MTGERLTGGVFQIQVRMKIAAPWAQRGSCDFATETAAVAQFSGCGELAEQAAAKGERAFAVYQRKLAPSQSKAGGREDLLFPGATLSQEMLLIVHFQDSKRNITCKIGNHLMLLAALTCITSFLISCD